MFRVGGFGCSVHGQECRVEKVEGKGLRGSSWEVDFRCEGVSLWFWVFGFRRRVRLTSRKVQSRVSDCVTM